MKPATGVASFVLISVVLVLAGCGGDLLSAPPEVKGAVVIAVTDLAATASQTTATITWTTEEPTTHLVEYGTASGAYSFATTQSLIADPAHSVSLSGLTDSTTYYYRVTSFDVTLSASVSAEGSFATTAFPGIHITAGPAAVPSQTTAAVTWTTDVPTTHLVEYGTASGLYELSTTQSQVSGTSHSVSLSGLTASATYYYRIWSFHATMPAAVSDESTITTTATPVILVTLIAAMPASPTEVTVTWTTDVQTTHQVEYGTTPGTYTYATALSQIAVTSHTVALSGLADSTTYYYRVRNVSSTLPVSVSAEASFSTGTITVTGLAVTPAAATATVTWTSSPATTAIVDFGTVSGTYTFSTYPSGPAATSHSVLLSGLTPATPYFYQVRNFVGSGPATVSLEGTFTTTAAVIVVTLLDEANITSATADITWTTDVATTHVVEYGTASGPPYMYSTLESAVGATSHTVSLSGLSALTTYYYRVRNYSASLPDSVSSQGTFATIDDTHPTLTEKLRGIWMVGGLSGGAIGAPIGPVDLYDPVTDTWYPAVTDLPVAVSFAAAESYGGKIYVIGGFNSAGTAQSIVQIYDVATNDWDDVGGTPMPFARANIVAAVATGRLYVLGGTLNAASATWSGQLTTYEYTPGGSWNQKANFGTATSERLSLAFSDVVYNLSGRNGAATVVGVAHDGFAATPNLLTTGATEVAMVTNRTGVTGVLYAPASGPAVMAIVGGFTALTGTTGNFIVQGTTASTPSQLFQYLYYPFTAPSTWANGGGGATYPHSLGFASAALYGSRMYVFGGTLSVVGSPTPSASGVRYVNSFNLATPASGSWTSAADMPVTRGRYGHVAVTIRQ